MNNYSNDGPKPPEVPTSGNIPELINRLFSLSEDQRSVLEDCRKFEYNITPPTPQAEMKKVDPEKLGYSVVERLNHLLTVMYDTNEQLRQHRNVLEGH